MIRKILCPVDFSDTSEVALDYALALGKRSGGQVSVMHVLPKVLADPDVYPYLTEPVLISQDTRERAFQLMGAFVHRALAQGIAADVIFEDGDVVDEIQKTSQKLGADLVVMGTHGRRGFRRLVLGSVTERLLRQSPVPVLSIAPSAPAAGKEGAAPFRRILCPVDFSPPSVAALKMAHEIGGGEAEVLVLHVLALYLGTALVAGIPLDVGDIVEQRRKEAEAQLEALAAGDTQSRARFEIASIESGAPYLEILRVAEREKSDLIVMGVAGRSAVDLMFFGSTANHVVRAAPCPVLLVK